jgi:hypothetical protein
MSVKRNERISNVLLLNLFCGMCYVMLDVVDTEQ